MALSYFNSYLHLLHTLCNYYYLDLNTHYNLGGMANTKGLLNHHKTQDHLKFKYFKLISLKSLYNYLQMQLFGDAKEILILRKWVAEQVEQSFDEGPMHVKQE